VLESRPGVEGGGSPLFPKAKKGGIRGVGLISENFALDKCDIIEI